MRLKEFLSVRGIEFESINILEDPAGRAELARLGARSIPILSRGDEFVFAQNIAQVVAFLKLNEKAGPVLSPAQLVARMERFIDAALRMIPQMPDDQLETLTPSRPRSYARLAHHMFRICEAFVEVAGGKFFSNGLPGEVHDPAEMASTAALAEYGGRVKARVENWWTATPDKEAQAEVDTYYGKQKLHEVLERATWHIGQHTRQWVMLLDMHGIAADRPLQPADFADLPMPKQVWDG
ncbi:MAG TPA: DinB family protein [Stellaceae bacterium]|nr:DinB family protein [Stellaceae bacterium]